MMHLWSARESRSCILASASLLLISVSGDDRVEKQVECECRWMWKAKCQLGPLLQPSCLHFSLRVPYAGPSGVQQQPKSTLSSPSNALRRPQVPHASRAPQTQSGSSPARSEHPTRPAQPSRGQYSPFY
ncbi:hypothetical protein LZ32DRAFT_284788 [Colletotrichum eremochloae]|nr:hypothetical protein LZ32DRAFT_284788 [Colletotrichum eremochloae]